MRVGVGFWLEKLPEIFTFLCVLCTYLRALVMAELMILETKWRYLGEMIMIVVRDGVLDLRVFFFKKSQQCDAIVEIG